MRYFIWIEKHTQSSLSLTKILLVVKKELLQSILNYRFESYYFSNKTWRNW